MSRYATLKSVSVCLKYRNTHSTEMEGDIDVSPSDMVAFDEPLLKLKSTSKIRATKTGTTAQKVDQLGMKPVAHRNLSLQCFFDASRAPGSSK